MVLEGCAEPNLACCILLRGASLQELIKVKKVVKFMLLACYNWKLEKAFLGDIEAILPEPGMTFDDDVNDNEVSKDDIVKNDITNDDTQSDEREKDDIKRKDSLNEESRKSNETDSTESSRSDNIFTNSSVKDTEKVDDKAVAPNNEDKVDKEVKVSLGDDPLQTTKPFGRKTESDKTLSCGVPIRDFSDPLRATLSVDDDVFLPKEEAKLKADTHTDRWSTDDVVLSMSPNVVIPAPYLESEAGLRGGLRGQLPRPRPSAPSPHAPRLSKHDARTSQSLPQLKDLHPFAKMAITAPADDPALKAALAHYRATGCRLVNDKHKPHCPMYKPSVVKRVKEPEQDPNEKSNDNEPLDPLAPENHQQLSLLFYSFSNKSANVPDFCVNPSLLKVTFLSGHETFSGLSEGDAEKDYQAFKQHMEQIHLALTSTSLQEHNTTAAVVRSLWSVSDRIISGEKMLREAQDKWSSPPAKNKAQTENADFEEGNEGDREGGERKRKRERECELWGEGGNISIGVVS
ncbi:hypothetical protein HF086_005089 [Spodoptera exigua]|uniref:Uncharacterized protein n=1 Tax=Spodoptera exigua TaxID=7107 RepID=A0A922SGB8_SPOEX|nr:hypothetical protein HF086_005089 [Spodoptera exigua]